MKKMIVYLRNCVEYIRPNRRVFHGESGYRDKEISSEQCYFQ